nr:response regulator transcription factor [uncultured Sediminibacterium sp.]
MQKKISLAFADDHTMLRKGLIRLVQIFGNYSILFEAENGEEVISSIKRNLIPDILVLDVNMGDKDGLYVAQWLNKHFPLVKILVLSMYSDETTILKMIQAGAHGYITKNAEPEKLHEAIQALWNTGSYIPESISKKIISGLQKNVLQGQPKVDLTENELKFLKLLCQQLTYQEIAAQMFLSPNSMDDYRKKLTRKLGVKGKSGLIVYAMENNLSDK